MPFAKNPLWPTQKSPVRTLEEKRRQREAEKFQLEVAQALTVSTDQDGPVRIRKLREGEWHG